MLVSYLATVRRQLIRNNCRLECPGIQCFFATTHDAFIYIQNKDSECSDHMTRIWNHKYTNKITNIYSFNFIIIHVFKFSCEQFLLKLLYIYFLVHPILICYHIILRFNYNRKKSKNSYTRHILINSEKVVVN